MKHDPDCIFCKIVAGEIPSTRVYEDENTLAFLDIGPIVKGHTLVIPKDHHDALADTPDEALERVIVVARKVAAALTNGLGASGVNLHQANGACAGQVVPHLHLHVVPRYDNDGHHWNWRAKEYGSMKEMAETAEKIKKGIYAGNRFHGTG